MVGERITCIFQARWPCLRMTEAAWRVADAAMQQDGAWEFLSFLLLGIPFVVIEASEQLTQHTE